MLLWIFFSLFYLNGTAFSRSHFHSVFIAHSLPPRVWIPPRPPYLFRPLSPSFFFPFTHIGHLDPHLLLCVPDILYAFFIPRTSGFYDLRHRKCFPHRLGTSSVLFLIRLPPTESFFCSFFNLSLFSHLFFSVCIFFPLKGFIVPRIRPYYGLSFSSVFSREIPPHSVIVSPPFLSRQCPNPQPSAVCPPPSFWLTLPSPFSWIISGTT